MRTHASASLDPSTVAARLGMCAVALAGTAATVTDANATVVNFTTPVSVPNTFDGVYINFLTGAIGSSGASVPGWDFNPYNSGVSLSFFWNGTPTGTSGGVAGSTTGPYLALGDGQSISSGSTFTAVTATVNTAAFRTVPGTYNLGFRFYNESTSATNYGYLSLTTGATNGFPLTINGWSFEDSGSSIIVTTVPEPGTAVMLSMGALALGAMNLRRLRRERRQLAS